jgi:hypothetical protein
MAREWSQREHGRDDLARIAAFRTWTRDQAKTRTEVRSGDEAYFAWKLA